jgi:hypothetical protein
MQLQRLRVMKNEHETNEEFFEQVKLENTPEGKIRAFLSLLPY